MPHGHLMRVPLSTQETKGIKMGRISQRVLAVCATTLMLALMVLPGAANASTGARWQTGLVSGKGFLSVDEHWTNIFIDLTGHRMTSSVYDNAGGPCGRSMRSESSSGCSRLDPRSSGESQFLRLVHWSFNGTFGESWWKPRLLAADQVPIRGHER